MSLTVKLSAIGEAIRAKTGKSDKLTLDQMPGEIESITGGGSGDVTLLEGLSFELDFSNGDMPFAAPNGYAVKSAIVKKPDTLIPANIKSGVEVAGITGTLSGGGANPDANDPVYYVTFMNGDQKLYVRPVAEHDDCADVVAKEWVQTPTKASTVQYNYTHYGWGADDGGAADANILKNITADKTVYAIYTSTVRTYAITYYDSDGTTVLKTEQVAYGTVPSYKPSKSGYVFDGWTTELVEVTGEASYTATWSEKLTFAGATWGDIARISEAGDAQKHFALGDTRVVNVDGVDVTFQIVGFDHDDLADGSGKAGISCMSKTLMGRKVAYAKSSNFEFYKESNLDALATGYITTLDPELQAVIKNVKKQVDNVRYMTLNDAKNATNNKTTINRKMWVPSRVELNPYPYGTNQTIGLGTKYAYMDYSKTARYPSNTATYYWLRDLWHNGSGSDNYRSAAAHGYMSGGGIKQSDTTTNDIILGFCI